MMRGAIWVNQDTSKDAAVLGCDQQIVGNFVTGGQAQQWCTCSTDVQKMRKNTLSGSVGEAGIMPNQISKFTKCNPNTPIAEYAPIYVNFLNPCCHVFHV